MNRTICYQLLIQMSVPFVRQGYYPNDDDYYIILDVDFNASQEAITTAYRNLARKYHPDKNNEDERSRKEAQVIFEKIKTAYDVLGDPRKRQIYDTLGPDGLKLDGWKLVQKQMTANEIRDEYLKMQKQNLDNKIAIIAKPRASFTMAIDATDMFSRSPKIDEEDDETESELDSGRRSLVSSIPAIEISSMSASMAFENNLTTNHLVTLSGNLNAKNGTGDGSFGTNYRYKYSPLTIFDLVYQVGRGPIFTAGVTHQLNDRTTITGRGYLVVGAYSFAPGAKLTLAHKIRDYLIGKVSYKEGINSSVTTSLIYINEKLMIEVTTSYKLSKLNQAVSVDFGYRFNNNESKLSVSMSVDTNSGVAVEYGCETRVLEINIIGATLSFSLPSGVTLKIRYNRANQEFTIPIYLSDEIHSAPLFYGTMVPLVTYYLVDRCYLKHYKKLR